MYAFRESCGAVEVALTDRHAPDGTPLNLALPGAPAAAVPGTDPVASLRRVTESFGDGATVVGMRQVHGSDVVTIDADWDGGEIEADGLVTDRDDLVLLVRVADCLPVLLADPDTGVVGVAHAGRTGMVHGVVPHTVEAMHALGARDVRAWLGPRACGACYEVPAAMQEQVRAQVPESASTTAWGTPALDIAAGVRAQLDRAGVTWTDVGGCTIEDESWWSHRRQGAAAGRIGGLVRRCP